MRELPRGPVRIARKGGSAPCQVATVLYRCFPKNLKASVWRWVWSYEDLEAGGGTEPLKLPAYMAAT